MAGKTHLEMAAQSLVEISQMQRESIEQMGQRMEAGFAKLTAAQIQLTSSVDQLSAKIDKLTDRADRIDDQLLTLSQNVNANQVIVASLVSLAEKQQATVDKLLAKN